MPNQNPMTTPEPSTRFTAEQVRAVEADIRRLNALSGGEEHEIADMLDAFADLLEARAAKPEPSTLEPLTTEQLDALWNTVKDWNEDGHTVHGSVWRRLIAQARAATNERLAFERLSAALTNGNASTWEQLFDAAEARAARPSPTCATCKWWRKIQTSKCDGECANAKTSVWLSESYFGCTLHEPSQPAQDGGSQ